MTGIVAQNVGRTSGLIKAAAGGGGAWTLIKPLTSGGSDDDLSFLNGTDDVVLDDTYPIYRFSFINIHPETDGVDFEFQADTGTNTSYNQTITSTTFRATHDEADSSTGLDYRTGEDQAQGTAFQDLNIGMGNDNDQCLNGHLHIFAPSDTTFVKHFMARIASPKDNDYHVDMFIAGYFNTTTALTRFKFKMSGGQIQGGKIKLYGLSDS